MSKRNFHVLLTSYELLMGAQDRPRLSRMHWHGIVVDEGHRWDISHALTRAECHIAAPATAHLLASCRSSIQQHNALSPGRVCLPSGVVMLVCRLKNADCKLSQELRCFKTSNRLLLTGVVQPTQFAPYQ